MYPRAQNVTAIRHFNTITGRDIKYPKGDLAFPDMWRLFDDAHNYPHFSRITDDVLTYRNENGELIIMAVYQ